MDVGWNERVSDGGVFRRNSLCTAIENDLLDVPHLRKIGQFLLSFVIIGNDTFPLKENLVKPFLIRGLSKEMRIANYRISRVRILSENVSGNHG